MRHWHNHECLQAVLSYVSVTINVLWSPMWPRAVREINKSSSTFFSTNISSNIVWLLQLHDTIQMKSNFTLINYSHDNIAKRSHIMIYNFVWNLVFATKFSSIHLAKGEKQSFVNLQRAKDGTHMFDAKYRYVFVVWISSNRTFGITPH